ncbi:receptor-type tyrosine-protein phosphatase eta-like [Leuresthes tenuis]|uniref:receptor-type tyrosine-protein phosphatase eta-like n=1 Tax=Leuresthes tenuis TaxID=355514 RepID=UPI003B513D8F
MDYKLIYFVLSGALLSVAVAQTRQYYFVSSQLNWTDAQSACRRDFTDLATIENTADVYAALNTTFNFTGKAWIGLHNDLLNSWKWSLNDSSFYGEGNTTFRNWYTAGGQPNNLGEKQYCVRLLSGSPYFGQWDDFDCNVAHRFVCYNGTVNGSSSFVINQNLSLTWTEAQRFCRENYVDLASIRNQTENAIITDLAGGSFVWIGLYRQKEWSDGSNSLFRHWAANEPNNGEHECVAASFADSGRWSDENCTQSLPFICYRPIPPNAESFRPSAQDETSITLQWNKVNNNVSFVLQFNGAETNISAPDGDGAVTHTVSSLTAGTEYTFTLYSVFDNVRSSGVSITAVTAPQNAQGFRKSGQDETRITLQWNKVNNNVSFVLQFNGTETNISAPDGVGALTHNVSSLAAGTKYTFTLFTVLENIRSSGVSINAVTAPQNAQGFRKSGQDETRITLQWNKVNNNVSFVLQFNGAETNISAPDGDGAVTHTVSSLTAGTKYTFTLYSVFDNVRSSGVSITAVTAPQNAQGFRKSGQDETRITLQWNKVNNNVSFVLQFNGAETNISAPDGDGAVTHTVSSLTAGTKYTFTLFSVFENVRSSGLQLTAVTAPRIPESLRLSQRDETSITLQWNKVNSYVSFVLQFNGTETYISASNGVVTHTVSYLTARTEYTFTLFSVFGNVRSSGVSITTETLPQNAEHFRPSAQDETSITLQWNKVNNNVSFVLQFNGAETNISAPDGDGAVTHRVSSLTAGTKYTFTLFTVLENVRSSGLQLTAVTAPRIPESLRLSQRDETSITLQWNKVNSYVSFVLQFNGTETYISASNGVVTHNVSSLTAGTEYTFTLFSVFGNVRSSGVSITTETLPQNAENFRSSAQDETSITLQWNTVNNNVSFVLQFNGIETNISAPDGDGTVTHTVSSLIAKTNYTFTLFSVFENVRSSGVRITATTGKMFYFIHICIDVKRQFSCSQWVSFTITDSGK